MLIILKFICLVFAIWFTSVNIGRIHHGLNVEGINHLIQALLIAGFVFLQFHLY